MIVNETTLQQRPNDLEVNINKSLYILQQICIGYVVCDKELLQIELKEKCKLILNLSIYSKCK